MPPDPDERFLASAPWQPIRYAANRAGIPEQTIRTWIRRAGLPTRKINGRLYVEVSAVEARTGWCVLDQ